MRNNMVKVEIYTTMACPFCIQTVSSLSAKNIAFEISDLTLIKVKRQAMRVLANGGTSVPQVSVNNEHIGVCDDLFSLNHAGYLDKLFSVVS